MAEQERPEEAPRSPSFFYWADHYPELELLFLNQDIIRQEIANISHWVPWPEDHFSLQQDDENTRDWTVFPLVHTFPAFMPEKKQWVASTCSVCPRTAALLKELPRVRTALFSKLGPGTQLASHTGWADLANHVLRVHLCLDIPSDGNCGLLVDGDVQYHKQGQIIVFDDSKPHRAFNFSETSERVVLIVDLVRPEGIPLGTAKGGHTEELDNFIEMFK